MKQLLDKVAPELISLDRDALAAVDVPTMQDKVNTKQSAPEYSLLKGGGEEQEAVREAEQY